MALNSYCEEKGFFSIFNRFYNSATSFYVFKKYSFFDKFNFKFSYVYLSQILWTNFFSDYSTFIEHYSKEHGKDFIKELNDQTHKHIITVLAFLQDEKASDFDSILSFRYISCLANNFITNKVLFNILSFFVKLDNTAFFVKK